MTSSFSNPEPPVASPWLPHVVEVRDIREEITGVATYDLAMHDPQTQADYRFQPGQFNMLYLPGVGEMAISISDDPSRRDAIAHTIRVAGNVSGTLARMKVGETLGLRGPYGTGWPLAECTGRDVVLVAGGIGLAPLRPVIYDLLSQPKRYGRLHLLFGARSPDTLLYADEFRDWSARGMHIQCTVDRSTLDWTGNVGVVTLLLERLREFEANNTVLFCCGPEVMMRFTTSTALQRGIPEGRLWVSTERNMQCAIGLCGHCQLGPEFVCKDGPVFRYDHIAPYLDIQGL